MADNMSSRLRGYDKAAAALVALIVIISGVFAVQEMQPRGNEHLPRSNPVVVTDDAAFRTGFAPLVTDAAAAAGELVDMGEARERNLLRIRGGQETMLHRLNAADAWLAAHPPPAAAGEAVAAYREGGEAVREAMREAQAGFLRFDFDRVARATKTMQAGAAALRRAGALLGAMSERTPVAGDVRHLTLTAAQTFAAHGRTSRTQWILAQCPLPTRGWRSP